MASRTHIALCLALLAVTVWKCAATAQEIDDVVPMSVRHENWMTQHGRSYKDEAEKQYRFKIFKENVEYIESVNRAGDGTYKLGVNKFADLTREEFRGAYTGYKPRLSGPAKATTHFRYENVSRVPAAVDWRKKGAVTPVKDQKTCGCCWAFTSVAATEGIIKIKTGKLIALSEQELVDCDSEKNAGCEGGVMDVAFKFIKHKGLTTEAKYPYENGQGKCRSKSSSEVHKISGHEDVPANSEASLMKAVANQPVSVGVDSSTLSFYAGGILKGPCGTELDHAVTVVGYGREADGTKYWLVRNSWGPSWGEEGYVKIERGIKEKEGRCGIAMEASYPVA